MLWIQVEYQPSTPAVGKRTSCWHTSQPYFPKRGFAFLALSYIQKKPASSALALTSRKGGGVATELMQGEPMCM